MIPILELFMFIFFKINSDCGVSMVNTIKKAAELISPGTL